MQYLEEMDGIGPKMLSLFQKLGICNIQDLITYYPRKYQVLMRTDMHLVRNGDKVVLDGILDGQPTVMHLSPKLKKVIFRIVSQGNVYHVGVFNQVYLCRELRYGMEITVIGKYDKTRNTIIANEVRMGKIPSPMKIEAIYHTTEGLNKKVIAKFVQNALKDKNNVKDILPSYLVEKYHFPEKLWSVQQIHQPSDIVSYKKAVQRLKYEELFLYLLKIQHLKIKRQQENQVIERKFDEQKLKEFISGLSFSLTRDQEKTVLEIRKDLISKKRMNRLVQGDVGSGKTIVAFLAAYMNYLSGYQTAMMVPTEILANQHYHGALELFQDTDMKVALLTSNVCKKEKKRVIDGLLNGEIDFVIGTQSLIQEGIIFSNLGLIITDEQHRFGVNQRNVLKNKGIFPDVLSMSATPIPRTYALTIYGDMDVSSIQTKPKGRLDVITYSKQEKQIREVLEMMKRELELGHQIYVIAPSISNEEKDELDNVLKIKEKMYLAFGKIACIDMVHGKLLPEEKNKVMKNFEEGKVSILISTTVIEVGVNVPNASMIVIFQANLFGLSTLHQLRGRVGRGNIQSYCVLLSKEESERLKVLEDTNDGFLISEYDFKMRGEGDLFGTRQSGEALLKLASIKRDFNLLLRVREDVLEFMERYSKNVDNDYLQGIL